MAYETNGKFPKFTRLLEILFVDLNKDYFGIAANKEVINKVWAFDLIDKAKKSAIYKEIMESSLRLYMKYYSSSGYVHSVNDEHVFPYPRSDYKNFVDDSFSEFTYDERKLRTNSKDTPELLKLVKETLPRYTLIGLNRQMNEFSQRPPIPLKVITPDLKKHILTRIVHKIQKIAGLKSPKIVSEKEHLKDVENRKNMLYNEENARITRSGSSVSSIARSSVSSIASAFLLNSRPSSTNSGISSGSISSFGSTDPFDGISPRSGYTTAESNSRDSN